jgi:5-formaminoimidazole-4-carboxamide-1-beta-D-ribofuranosyl 5'-monophosphate synthetase
MRYLVTTNEAFEPFFTEWFDLENNFNAQLDMVVYDLVNRKYSTDGKTWHEILIDHL